ncbi:M20/M25/M40 family metallo-hydrolase [Simiduia sp. 21SJ11W-1]|uniref:M20/M25/M40 family metallo-hydrolase n=1 Tax=Simiduia sp. 21SJ11W-1 TaxID=2909669 RepID=UPI00209D4B37|nr:M20/M25/M40 family metallo-hydrolase [Simiduia sp. 21SJ11W-1]UTA46773.1 M20/M25/M40 family metallo-hydrolase [Simiduia sp. 21SJ11W-1]
MIGMSNFIRISLLAAVSLCTSLSTWAAPERVWISIGSDAVERASIQRFRGVDLRPVKTLGNAGISLATIPADQIDLLSQFMHDEFHRCGGFVFHESQEAAQQFALASSAPPVAALAVSYSIDNPAGVAMLLDEMSSANLVATVNSLSAYHNRYYTQQTGADAANWIRNQWASIASSRGDISVELYDHSWLQDSVVATITGSTYPDEVVVIGGHLDSINGGNPSGGRAPGADDNASGIAVATETLRAMVASGFKPARTVKIMGYAAEEVGLRGSKDIAEAHKAQNVNVVGVAQFDMSGYKGTGNRDIVFMTDYTNSAQNQFMGNLIDAYLPGLTYGFDQCGYGCSDHASWHAQGYAASMPFESNMADYNSNIHTAYDNTFDAGHSIKFARLAAAYVAELAKGGDGSTPPPPPGNTLENGVAKTGLGANQGSDLTFTMAVPAGATNISFAISGGSGDADLYVRFGAAPTDTVYDCRPYKNGNNETCTATQSGGTYHLRVKAYSSFSGVSLVGQYTEGGNTNEPINETHSNINLSRGQWARYTQSLAAGYSKLVVTMSGGSGDADLYVRQGAESTTSQYDCRPYKNGNNESCTFNAPAAGTWHIDVRGYTAASGVTLTIQGTP